jgi:hypothetical protein
MNSKSNGNNNIRYYVAIVLIAVFVPILVAGGEREKHNPYTVLGMQVRSHLLPDTPGANGDDLGPLVFQEIIPCRFVSTLEADQYREPWGGKEYQIMESRTYWPKGVLVAGDGWVNPCSEKVPTDAVAIATRLMSYEAAGQGSVFLTPATYRTNNIPALWFEGGKDEMREATVVLRDHAFSVLTDQQTHMTIDIIGYFKEDPKGSGPKGDKGERGERGEKGEQGLQGLQGERGEKGEAGAQGLKGDQGEAGAQGLKGDKGEAGAQGLKGDKGDAGAQGLKGDKGDAGAQGLKGDKGEAGAQGLKGDKGEAGAQGLKGDKGDAGAQGLKGDKGEAGAQGLKGDKGDAGAQGLKGDKGDKGDRGEAGAQGAHGSQGPAGPQGPQGPRGLPGVLANTGGPYTFPPGGSIRITDSDVKPNSFIVLMYVEVSNGNALGVASVSNGSFVASGSPNKPFKYLILTPQ